MSSFSKSPIPSPKSSPRLKSLPLPPLPHSSSSESSTPTKISSPLNSKHTTPLSSSPDTGGIEQRLRVDSTGSTIRDPSPSRANARSQLVPTNHLKRGRSPSPRRERIGSASRGSDPEAPELGDSWWGSRELLARPWQEPLKRKKTIPPEQSERWEITRRVRDPHISQCHPLICSFQRVASAVVSVLGTAGDVTHELLRVGVEVVGLAPIPGLEPAARTLLRIWDTLQQVDVNLPSFPTFPPAHT